MRAQSRVPARVYIAHVAFCTGRNRFQNGYVHRRRRRFVLLLFFLLF